MVYLTHIYAGIYEILSNEAKPANLSKLLNLIIFFTLLLEMIFKWFL